MITIVKNKYLNTLLLLMLFSAVAHMVVVLFIAVVDWNVAALNYFQIINLDYFFPVLSSGFWSDIAAAATVAALYIIILVINRKQP
jgi:hypothetical protein